MNKSQVIGIINDPEVTLGHLEKRNIILLNAWEVNWSDLTPEYSYILLGGHMELTILLIIHIWKKKRSGFQKL